MTTAYRNIWHQFQEYTLLLELSSWMEQASYLAIPLCHIILAPGPLLSQAYFDFKEDVCMDGADICMCAIVCFAHTHWFNGWTTSVKILSLFYSRKVCLDANWEASSQQSFWVHTKLWQCWNQPKQTKSHKHNRLGRIKERVSKAYVLYGLYKQNWAKLFLAFFWVSNFHKKKYLLFLKHNKVWPDLF